MRIFLVALVLGLTLLRQARGKHFLVETEDKQDGGYDDSDSYDDLDVYDDLDGEDELDDDAELDGNDGGKDYWDDGKGRHRK